MQDVLQRALEAFAQLNTVTREGAIACAVALLYVLGAAWVLVVVSKRTRLTGIMVARIGLVLLLSYLASLVLTALISDPRPYIVAHTQPLAPVGHDNGFPSDHTLLAATLAAGLWWLDRRLALLFGAGALLVGLGRLAIGAHHTLDIVGSIAIAIVAAILAQALPLPAAWGRPLRLRHGRRAPADLPERLR